MTLVLREADVRGLLAMNDCIAWLEESFKAYAAGQAHNLPRARVRHPSGILHVLPAADLSVGAIGLKTYTSGRGGTRFLVVLSSSTTGELLALVEADYLGQVRTGAASGLATKYMARPEARRCGIYGTGSQARTQLEAVATVRSLERATAWGRDASRREQFCREMSDALGIPVRPAAAPEEAARGQDVVITITTAREPVLRGEWLEAGAHVNAAGSNSILRREIDDAAVERASHIVIDSRQQGKLECGDLLSPAERGVVDWDQLVELAEVVVNPRLGRTSADDITIFESLGLGLEDVTVAMRLYERARAAGIGQEVELFADVKPRAGR